jgi:hypothetical protein
MIRLVAFDVLTIFGIGKNIDGFILIIIEPYRCTHKCKVLDALIETLSLD